MLIDVRTLANQAIQVTNPNISIDWVKSIGYSTNAAGRRQNVTTTTTIQGQVQGLSAGDMQFVDGLNLEGLLRSVHMYGNVQGLVRSDQKGGDFLRFPQVPGGVPQDWKVIQVMETWPTWARVIVCLQSVDPTIFNPLFSGGRLQGNGILLNTSVLGVQ